LSQQMRNHHVFRLETAAQAQACSWIRVQHYLERLFRGEMLNFTRNLVDLH
jgi:hypothetical protein